MAFGGMMTAVCLVIMCMGSLIPVNTYVCPVLCILVTKLVLERCGRRFAWCCYLAVAVLSLLLAPDKEAALVYVLLGYYPMWNSRFDRLPKWAALAAKLIFFSGAGFVVYWVGLTVLGLASMQEEFREAGAILGIVTLVLWDAVFLMTDRLLTLRPKRRK